MGMRYWKTGGPLLLVLPNVTALLLLAATLLVLNWPPVSITSPTLRISRDGVQIAQLGELNRHTGARAHTHTPAFFLLLKVNVYVSTAVYVASQLRQDK